jgi:hypothetical protein
MTTINYSGIGTDCYGILSTEGFHYLLKNHPNLDLVEVTYDDDTDDEIFTVIKAPLHAEPENCVGLIDRTDNDKFMWVLYDDYASVEDPSDSLIEALTIMDAFTTRTQETRLFETKHEGVYLDDTRLLEADFDFEAGEYIL